MKEPSSRRFAVGFATAMVVITLTLAFFGWRHLYPNDEFEVSAEVSNEAGSFTVQVQPSEPLYVYVLEEDVDGTVRALFPNDQGPGNPIPPKRNALELPNPSADSVLLLMAGARPLWSLDEGIHESRKKGRTIPELERDAVLSVRGLPSRPLDGPVSAVLPELAEGPESRNGLWARRWTP